MIVYFLITAFLLLVILFLLLRKKDEKSKGGFQGYNQERVEIKERNKEKIMNMLKERGRITNQEVEELLNVSDATATRYLDELENNGKIIQEGNRHRAYYKIL